MLLQDFAATVDFPALIISEVIAIVFNFFIKIWKLNIGFECFELLRYNWTWFS